MSARLLFALTAACLGSAVLSSRAYAGDKTYCCADGTGHQICSDILPQQCYGRAYRILGPGGNLIQNVEAPLTPEQRRSREEEAKRKQNEERAKADERRRNQILLDTYPTVEQLESMRERSIKEIEQGMLQAQQQLQEFTEKKKRLAEEAEFYKGRKMPYELSAAIRANDADIEAQQGVIDAKKKDIDAVNARFDADKRRYLELTGGRNSAAQ